MEQLFRGHTPTLAFIQTFVHKKKTTFCFRPDRERVQYRRLPLTRPQPTILDFQAFPTNNKHYAYTGSS